MNLPKETRKEFNRIYDELAEELRIFYQALRREGFDVSEAMQIIIAFINQPVKIESIKRDRGWKIDQLKQYIDREKERGKFE